jgi:hypothetical protein
MCSGAYVYRNRAGYNEVTASCAPFDSHKAWWMKLTCAAYRKKREWKAYCGKREVTNGGRR